MNAQKGETRNYLFDKLMPMAYGIGAAVVICGAMFKIMHWPGAGFMLVAGLTTEAFIFFLSAFQPQPSTGSVSKDSNTTKQLDNMLQKGGIESHLIENLGKGMKTLAETASKMSSINDATIATSEYAKNVKEASKSMLDLNKSYSGVITAMSDMSNASKDSKEYHMQVQAITKNLGALNAVYETELKDANNHVKAMGSFYKNLSTAVESMTEAAKDTQQFKMELSKLTTNLTNLNKIYGNMLSAMKV